MSQLTFPAALNEQLSEADSQFRQGHFDSADELYTQLLADIEKLEDFEKALSNYRKSKDRRAPSYAAELEKDVKEEFPGGLPQH